MDNPRYIQYEDVDVVGEIVHITEINPDSSITELRLYHPMRPGGFDTRITINRTKSQLLGGLKALSKDAGRIAAGKAGPKDDRAPIIRTLIEDKSDTSSSISTTVITGWVRVDAKGEVVTLLLTHVFVEKPRKLNGKINHHLTQRVLMRMTFDDLQQLISDLSMLVVSRGCEAA